MWGMPLTRSPPLFFLTRSEIDLHQADLSSLNNFSQLHHEGLCHFYARFGRVFYDGLAILEPHGLAIRQEAGAGNATDALSSSVGATSTDTTIVNPTGGASATDIATATSPAATESAGVSATETGAVPTSTGAPGNGNGNGTETATSPTAPTETAAPPASSNPANTTTGAPATSTGAANTGAVTVTVTKTVVRAVWGFYDEVGCVKVMVYRLVTPKLLEVEREARAERVEKAGRVERTVKVERTAKVGRTVREVKEARAVMVEITLLPQR
ncbi:hypothetical protein AG1IA_05103 [Rhizoctonia solani AG-1 IA]|uniref:Uncharacterized protein n=1 Tax=Thanatephorus cucumeris (strain AG1-IA) TaxID=983506 RepID=L8WWZ7_THACA|nr:hypothetical protein AG1IA_05103 [Rhizoctonia solani AG-1 IA]